MKDQFLRQIALKFASEENFTRYTFIFPNRRSSLFFKKYLSQAVAKPIFAPCITTISEFFEKLCPYKNLSKLELKYELWRVYNKFYPSESFDDFFYWGDLLLNDFSDIDQYRVDASGLFANLKDINQIQSDYSFLSKEQQEALIRLVGLKNDKALQGRFFTLWNTLYEIYTLFKSSLQAQGKAYSAMGLRWVADNIKSEGLQQELYRIEKAVFIGFSAPTECEKAVMRYFRDKKRSDGSSAGDFYWDYYSTMLKDEKNCSSRLIKSCITEFPSHFTIEPPSEREPVFKAYNAAGQGGQIAAVSLILSALDSSNPIDTAIVVSDEKLLLPLLSAIPNKYRGKEGKPSINITMGYPLSATMAYSLIKSLLENYTPAEKPENAEKSENVLPEVCLYLKEKLLEEFEKQTDENKSYILVAIDVLSRLQKFEVNIGRLSIANSVILKSLKGESIAFKGEPLEGVQIMGALETRLLDFENIIFLSFNEGVYPRSGYQQSGIPYFLRKAFGLPTFETKDSISAYNFYRLIQRASNVYCIYDTAPSDLKLNEESRFLKQLKYAFSRPIEYHNILYDTSSVAPTEPCKILKTKEIADKIAGLEFSASSLKSYLHCPLKFYFEKILEAKIEDEPSDTIDSKTFGSIFHKAAEEKYKAGEKADIEEVIKQAFASEYGSEKISGENIIIFNLVKTYLRQIAKYEGGLPQKQRTLFLRAELEIHTTLFGSKFVARVDRLDVSPEGAPVIIDYKTGNFRPKKINLDRIFDVGNYLRDESDEIFFQMLLYAALFLEDLQQRPAEYAKYNFSIENGINVAVYALRRIALEGPYCHTFSLEEIEEFKKRLSELLRQIKTFSQDKDKIYFTKAEQCGFCDYIRYCNLKEDEK